MRKSLTALVALLVVFPAELYAQGEVLIPGRETPTTRVGTRGAEFLNLAVGARAQALGGAYPAVASGVSALYWNVAGIASVERFAAGVSVADIFADADITHYFVGAIVPVGLWRFGVSLTLASTESRWGPRFST